MQFSAVIRAFCYLVLVFLCLALFLLSPAVASSSSSSTTSTTTAASNLLCLRAKNRNSNALSLLSHPVRRYLDDKDSKTDSLPLLAATKAHLSPVVFKGTLLSVLVQRDGTVRAAFGVDQALKVDGGGSLKKVVGGQMEVVYLQGPREDGECFFDVNEDNLRLGNQYVVYGRFLDETRSSVIATAFPIEYERRTFKAIKRVVCRGCAKPPRVEGLTRNVKIAERRKLRLQCHLSGNPIPWVEWYKNGQPIDVSAGTKGRIKVRTRRRTSRLIIRQTRLQDNGVYECRAVNVVQKFPAIAKAVVTVTRKSTKKPKIKTTTTTTVSSLWPTGACPNSDFCLNGGTCIFYRDVREYVCHCADGFVGLRCDYKDVRASLGGVKNMERDHNRLYVTVVLLFIFLSCLNWCSLLSCWICCFRKQGSLRRMVSVNKLLKFTRRSKEKKISIGNVRGSLSSDYISDQTLKKRDEMTSQSNEDDIDESDQFFASQSIKMKFKEPTASEEKIKALNSDGMSLKNYSPPRTPRPSDAYEIIRENIEVEQNT